MSGLKCKIQVKDQCSEHAPYDPTLEYVINEVDISQLCSSIIHNFVTLERFCASLFEV